MCSTAQTVDMPSVLRRWEEVIGHPFSGDVWADYQHVENDTIVFFECAECSFGMFEPVLPGTENFYREISAIDYYNAEKWEFGQAAGEIDTFAARNVLDVGCGSGIFLEFLKKRLPDANLCGFDLNADLLKELAAHGFSTLPNNPERFSEAMEGQPLFDAITMLQVLEHVADPQAFVKLFLPMLRPGGLLIITTPNFKGPIRNFPDALTEVPPHHTTRWNEKAFRYLLKGLGLVPRSVALEPLPDYLWESYLPEMWDQGIWPSHIFDPIARGRGLVSVGERSGMAAQEMRNMGIRWLEGVDGHTIYVSALKNGDD